MSECLYCKKPVFTENRFCSNKCKNNYYESRRGSHRNIQIKAYGVHVNVPAEIKQARVDKRLDKVKTR